MFSDATETFDLEDNNSLLHAANMFLFGDAVGNAVDSLCEPDNALDINQFVMDDVPDDVSDDMDVIKIDDPDVMRSVQNEYIRQKNKSKKPRRVRARPDASNECELPPVPVVEARPASEEGVVTVEAFAIDDDLPHVTPTMPKMPKIKNTITKDRGQKSIAGRKQFGWTPDHIAFIQQNALLKSKDHKVQHGRWETLYAIFIQNFPGVDAFVSQDALMLKSKRVLKKLENQN